MRFRQHALVSSCLLLAGCSLNLPPDAFKDLELFPDPEPVPSGYEFSSREQVQDYLSSRERLDSIEGIWRFGGGAPPQDQVYEVAIVKEDNADLSDREFLGIVINSSNEKFHSGDLKFTLGPEDANGMREGIYYVGNATDRSTSFRVVEKDLIVTFVMAGGEWQILDIRRVDPTVGNDQKDAE